MSRSLFVLAALILSVGGCTSLGQGGRAVPKITRPIQSPIIEIGLDGDDNELSVAVEKLLESRGVKVRVLSTPLVREQRGNKEYTYEEVQTRYMVRVRSFDRDRCIPEGSRQMDFTLSVVDFTERSRIFLAQGEHSCRDTIIENFSKWLGSAGR